MSIFLLFYDGIHKRHHRKISKFIYTPHTTHANSSFSAPWAPPTNRVNAIDSSALDSQHIATNAAEDPHRRRSPKRSQRILDAAHNETARALAKQRGRGVERHAAPSSLASRRVGSLSPKPSQLHMRPEAATQTALRQRDRQAALGDVVRARQLAGAHRLADRLLRRGHRVDVDRRQAVRQLLAPQLGQLARVERRRERPHNAIASPARTNPSRPARRASGKAPTMPITGVG